MHVIDRRPNPRGKSLSNRQRFLRRARALVRQAVRDASAQRSIKDVEKGGDVVIPGSGVREPVFRRDPHEGVRDHVLPGNREYVAGDEIRKPRGGQGGRGSEASDDGEGEDAFRFALSDQEFLDLFLEDLELPDLAKRRLATLENPAWRRAGFMAYGSPANLSVARTLRNSMSRRIALRRPKRGAIEALTEALEAARAAGDEAEAERLTLELEQASKRLSLIPYIDPIDVRYRRFEPTPKPITQAVMFCLMDVSGSMTEHMKDLAKRFYMLLYVFLKRRYRHVDVVFIRHTHRAEEVDEDTFFYSPETGGTVVSTALEEMLRVVTARYRPEDWNIYAAQASDGDNLGADNDKTAALLTSAILPLCQYFAYLEVASEDEPDASFPHQRPSALWRTYRTLTGPDVPLTMRRVRRRTEIYPVFRELFEKKSAGAAA
jgi:uncharacterized sporulation protein YeaH/YhbH (DUF444 family)